MTILIADNSPRISYTATSGQTAFTVPFEFFDNTDLNVYINDTLQTLTTHYTVTGGSGSTGSITLVTGATAGDIVVITRDVTLERTTDFPTSGPFQVASLNTELDKVVAMIADMKDLADRGLRLSDSDTSAALVLANKDDRKGTVLAFNEITGAVEIGPTIADTNTVAQIKADINTVAGISANVTTVAGISSDVTTVATNNANVTTVAGQTTNMQNITDNLTDVQNAATNATNAAASATAAASSAASASFSEAGANTSETNAATSATNASNSASAASTSASAASTSATAAASSATAAAASETAAGTSETNAATSATNAATSATNAGTSETNAASSATAAAASATSASAAQTAAESARDSALASFDSFDDRYLGTKTSDPTVDNDGDALVAGALYFNSTDGEMKVYNGTSWVDAYADGASLVAKSGDTMTGNLSFGDNNKAIFGAGSDLQIYHDGTYNFINAASGQFIFMQADELRLRSSTGETYFASTLNGATSLYHDASLKLATTSTGVDVTGTVTSEGLTISDDYPQIIFTDTNHNPDWTIIGANGRIGFFDSTNAVEVAQITSTGIDVTGDAVINLASTTGTTLGQKGGLELFAFSTTVGNGGEITWQSGTGSTETWAAISGYITNNTAQGSAGHVVIGTKESVTDTGLSERMRIANNGDISFYEDTGTTAKLFWDASAERLGIGTSSPATLLDVKSSGTSAETVAQFGNNNIQGGLQVQTNGNLDWGFNALNTRNLTFSTNQTERMRIDSSGNVTLGAGGTYRLDINAPTATSAKISCDNTPMEIGTHDNHDLKFITNNTEDMRLETDGDLHVDGNVVAYSTTISDIRLKKDIAPIEDAVTKVQQLNGCTFTYLKDDRKSAGLIAQDVEKVLPSAVIEDEAVFHGEEGETYKTVQYDQLIGLLVEAVKELKAEIEELKNGTSK